MSSWRSAHKTYRVLSALTIAIVLALTFHVRPQAFSSCDLGISCTPEGYCEFTHMDIFDVESGETPAWAYIDWGDGSSSYVEKYETGSVSFNGSASHQYAAGSWYWAQMSIGTTPAPSWQQVCGTLGVPLYFGS